MSETDAMRPAAPLRQPYPAGMSPQRPGSGILPTGPPRNVGPMPSPQNPNLMRAMPPPLRNTDIRNNMNMGPGPPPGVAGTRPPLPLGMQQQQQMRPTTEGGPMSPLGPRPPGPYSSIQPNRPQNQYPVNMPPGRPTFPRPPGSASAIGSPTAGQAPQFPRPPHYMQSPQSGQPMPQPIQQQQLPAKQPPKPPLPMQRPPSSSSNYNDDDDDDDDVVVGQAMTPIKSVFVKQEPKGPSIREDIETPFKNSTVIEASTTEPKKPVSALYKPIHTVTTPSNDKSKHMIKGDNDSGVDESTQEKDRNGPGSPSSPAKTPTSTSSKPDKTGIPRPPSATPSSKSNKSRSTSRNRLLLKTPDPEPIKKLPMNKVQVGHAPSPNLKAVRSKIGSLDNAAYKPGGGHVKIESKKIDIKATPRIEAKNDKYTPRGGDKKIVSTKLQWNAKSKIGSLENAHHKPGGGDKKIESLKTDFKDKAKPKVGSKDNVKYTPGGGDIKENTNKDIQSQKIEIKAQSKVGSLDNVKHRPGGGEKKIFDDKDYLKNVEHTVGVTSPSQSPLPSSMTTSTSIGADENLNQQS